MKALATIALLLATTAAADAQSAYSFWRLNPYGPWRIQPGFRAPPLPNPYLPALAAQHGQPPPPPEAYGAVPEPPLAYAPPDEPPQQALPPAPAYAPPSPPPLGWIWGAFTICVDPPGCRGIVVSVGADGLNVRVAPDGPVVGALANGVPVIPLSRQGPWVLIAPACALAPTFTWSVTAGVPLSVCM